MQSISVRAALRPRAYVRVAGPDAEDYLQRMLSNDVTAGDLVPALLLTPKGRLIAPVRMWRRGPEDFLLLTEPELGDVVRATLLRSRFASKCEIEPEQHTSSVVFGESEGLPGEIPGTVEVLDARVPGAAGNDELEHARIEAGVPRWTGATTRSPAGDLDRYASRSRRAATRVRSRLRACGTRGT